MDDTAMPIEDAASRASDATVAEAPGAPAESLPSQRPRLARRADLTQLLDAKAAGDGESKDAPKAPDAWLERRLRVFERQMSTIEQRQEQVEKNARAAAGMAEDAIKAMQETLKSIQDRADAAEAKAKATAVELRTALNEATLRIQTVEGVARAALAEHHSSDAPPAHVPVLDVGQLTDDAGREPPHGDGEAPKDGEAYEPAPKVESPNGYLADVRKSVAAATAAAEAAAAHKPATTVRNRLTRYISGGLAVMVLFVAGAGVAFSKGVSDGRIDAIRHAAHHAPMDFAFAERARTPLDRLTDRARAGDPAAELGVGVRYLDGPNKDAVAAFHWIALAAMHGQPVAQFRLASMYAVGTGTHADPARALQWYEAAALQGNRRAMHNLGVAYAEGLGTAKNPAEAVRWLSRSASYGLVDSQFNLAVLYERGEGVPQSLLDAYKWYAVAGRQGDLESKQRIEALKTQLSADDVAAAEQAAHAFHPTPLVTAANTL